MKTYPISLVHLDHKKCVLIGGGKIAARKAQGLIDSGANLVIISPEVNSDLQKLIREKSIDYHRRKYQTGDLLNAFLVIAATDNPEVNHQIWIDACEMNILINVVDDPEHCNFIAPAIVRRGPLSIAISSGGNCPSLSRHLRQKLEKEYGPEYETYVMLLGEIRDLSLTAIPPEIRQPFWEQLMNSEVLDLIKTGHEAQARSLAYKILEQCAGPKEG